jgi:hypothetical protein
MPTALTTDNWTGGTAEWLTNVDWSLGYAPASSGMVSGATIAATLSNGSTITVSDASAEAGTLTVSSGTVSIISGGSLTLGGFSVTGSGTLTVNGGELITGGDEISDNSYSQSGNVTLENNASFQAGTTGLTGSVSGTVTIESGSEYLWQDSLASSSSGNIVNFAGGGGGTFAIQAAWGGTIDNFNTSNENELSYGAQINSFSYSTSTKILTVVTTSGTYTEKFADNSTALTSNSFALTNGGYAINYNGAVAVIGPDVTGATYNAATGALTVTGSQFTTNAGDFDPTQLTLTGEDDLQYTLTGGTVSNVSSTSFTVTLTAADQLQLDGLFDNNGNNSTGNDIFNSGGPTNYTISATAAFDVGGNASTSGLNGVAVSNALTPTITSVSYNRTTGVLTLTGTGFEDSGGYGGINLGQITLKNSSSGSFTFNAQDYGNATSATQATIDLSNTTPGLFTQEVQSGEEASVNTLFGASGPFTLTATSGWDAGAGAAITSLGVTLIGAPATIISESDSSPSGTDIDAGKTVTFTVTFSEAVTATGSPA